MFIEAAAEAIRHHSLLYVEGMRKLLQRVREALHPLYYIRKSSIGRALIRFVDMPVWLWAPRINFKIRGRLITHGLGFSAAGSNEPAVEAMALGSVELLGVTSFWDVGANIGFYTWLLKSSSPSLQAVLIEASPFNAALIKSTLEKNKFVGVELIAAGASDSTGQGLLRVDSEAGATSTLDKTAPQTFEEQHWGVSSRPVAIPLVTIDQERSRRTRVDFIKIDVEGHEAAVLRGAEKTISTDQPIILVECFHPDRACLQPLLDLGYKFFDGDRLSETLEYRTSNYFGFPKRFHSAIGPVLQFAGQRLKS